VKIIWRTKKDSLMYQSLQLVGDPPPLLVFEISEQGVAGVRRNPKTLAVEARAFQPLPQGAVEPSAVRENVHEPGEFQQAVQTVLQELGPAKRPDAALILPDDSSRLTVLDLDKLPADARERLALIRWRLKKTVPFDIERARISYQPQPSPAGVSVLVAATPPEVVQQYEAPFQQAGLFPGYVSLSTAAALNLTRGGGMNVLAKMAGGTLTIVALANGAVRMIRHVDLAEHPPNAVEARLQDMVSDLFPTCVFIKDNLGAEVSKLLLCGFGSLLQRALEFFPGELGCEVEPLRSPGGVVSGNEAGLWGYMHVN
jgi:type IV pilus assembly protein PilM